MTRFQIRTIVQLNDDEDMDVIAQSVDYEELDEDGFPGGPRDFQSCGELIDTQTKEDGLFKTMIFERFDTEYDRNAERSFPVVITTTVERMDA